MYKPYFSENFKKQFSKLPSYLQKKFLKQLKLILTDFHHPSLRSRKMAGTERFEARLDYHQRFTYRISDDEIWFLSIGPHDEGLGKK